jgi:hypothetical protein
MQYICKFIISILLFFCFSAASYHLDRGLNFDSCYNLKIKLLNVSDCGQNEFQVCPLEPKPSSSTAQSPAILTLEGCKHYCGDGTGLWSANETMCRFVLWVLPAFILIAHFHFAPLSAWNTCNVVIHLLGDPVDSMWSMLTRQEVNRRLHRLTINSGLPEALVNIWAAYEELGWQEVSSFTFRIPGKWNTAANSLPMFSRTPARTSSLNHVESYLIKRASYRLSSNRSDSSLGTWAAIIGLLGALAGAFIRTWTQRLNNQTPHTIAIVTLLFHFIALVKISGNIGAFTSSTAAVDVLQELRRDLQAYSSSHEDKCVYPLFPPLDFQSDALWDYRLRLRSIPGLGRRSRRYTDYDNVEVWPRMASWLGMNSPWRPCKEILVMDTCPKSVRHPIKLFRACKLFLVSISFVLIGSYAPAIYLSYHSGQAGFGCRCLAWTCVMIGWMTSLGLDQLLKRWFRLSRNLWRWTICKDSVISFFVIGVILSVQLGFFNNCWCRAGTIYLRSEPRVYLGPPTDQQWKQSWYHWISAPAWGLLWTASLIWLAGYGGGNARRLLCKNDRERDEHLLRLERAREDLESRRMLHGPSEEQIPQVLQLLPEVRTGPGSPLLQEGEKQENIELEGRRVA